MSDEIKIQLPDGLVLERWECEARKGLDTIRITYANMQAAEAVPLWDDVEIIATPGRVPASLAGYPLNQWYISLEGQEDTAPETHCLRRISPRRWFLRFESKDYVHRSHLTALLEALERHTQRTDQ